jgi:hypothetical protein
MRPARAQRHHRKFPPPVESLQLTNRPDGSLLVRAVNSRRPVVHVPERRELSARPRERRPRVRRSSGSRGDPSRSDEADPPLARCSHCGEQFTPARSDAKFCGRACKQAAYRRRQQPPRSLSDVVWKLRHDGEIDGVEALWGKESGFGRERSTASRRCRFRLRLVLMSFLYRLLCGLVRVSARGGGERELEIIVLRHQLPILRRQASGRGTRRPTEPCWLRVGADYPVRDAEPASEG